MTPTKAEFIGGPRDGQVFWSRGEKVWEMWDPHDEYGRNIVYLMGWPLPNGRTAYLWHGYVFGDIQEIRLV